MGEQYSNTMGLFSKKVDVIHLNGETNAYLFVTKANESQKYVFIFLIQIPMFNRLTVYNPEQRITNERKTVRFSVGSLLLNK